jgi:hypothetical protein
MVRMVSLQNSERDAMVRVNSSGRVARMVRVSPTNVELPT